MRQKSRPLVGEQGDVSVTLLSILKPIFLPITEYHVHTDHGDSD